MTQKSPPRLFGMMPGALMYRIATSNDPASAELDIVRQVRSLPSSAAFENIPETQLLTLTDSIAHTIGRVDYHRHRFQLQRVSLDSIRRWAPGDIFFDSGVSPMHYELQAMAGAARLLVDELIFLITRRHGQREWEATPLLRDPIVPGSSKDVPEVHRLRSHRTWFEMLNAYRNTFFHRGWKHGAGHFGSGSGRASGLPTMNAFLVPDQASLIKGSRPYDWTYNDGATVDNVVTSICQGMLALVGDLCANEWDTTVPPAGSVADHERPNLFVALPVPFTLLLGDFLLVPIYSSRELALDLVHHVPELSARVDAGECELTEVQSCSDVTGTDAVSISLAQLTPEPVVRLLRMCIDPEPQDPEWSNIKAVAVVELPLEQLLADDMRMVAIAVPAPMTAYIWRTPFLIR